MYAIRSYYGNYSDGYKLPASVDEVRIWKTAVDPSVLKAWSHKEVTENHPNYGSLLAYYKFTCRYRRPFL